MNHKQWERFVREAPPYAPWGRGHVPLPVGGCGCWLPKAEAQGRCWEDTSIFWVPFSSFLGGRSWGLTQREVARRYGAPQRLLPALPAGSFPRSPISIPTGWALPALMPRILWRPRPQKTLRGRGVGVWPATRGPPSTWGCTELRGVAIVVKEVPTLGTLGASPRPGWLALCSNLSLRSQLFCAETPIRTNRFCSENWNKQVTGPG